MAIIVQYVFLVNYRRQALILIHLGHAGRSRSFEIPGFVEQVVEDHQVIVAALKSRNPDRARQAMLRHLNHVEASLLRLVEEQSLS